MRKVAFLFALMLIFSIPLENSIALPGIGTLTKIIGVLTAAAWLLAVLADGGLRRPHPLHFWALAFLVWNVAGAFWSINLDMTLVRIKTYTQMVAMTLILWDLITTKKELNASMQAYILGAGAALGTLLFNYANGRSLEQGRYSATGFNPNDFSLIIALAIPLAFSLASSKKNSKVFQGINYAFIPLAFFAIFLTASRGSFVAVMPAIVFIAISVQRIGPMMRFPILFILLSAIVAAFTLLPEANIQRLTSVLTSIQSGEFGGRGIIWQESVSVFKKFPLAGVGSGTLPSVHNVFLSIVTETGLIGFSIFAVLLIVVFHKAIQQPKWTALLWISVLMIWTIGAFIHTWENRKPTWLMFSFIIISSSIFKEAEPALARPACWPIHAHVTQAKS
ncbi:MAG: hypothetical protein VR64_06910 [Desulfatitalea sp. BRH_c12]|nr:MAG: hypothetical protein VR64_06910 [Desulfatitalea sp. BRH_c12]